MGNIENFIERLHICVIGFARTSAPPLRNLEEMSRFDHELLSKGL